MNPIANKKESEILDYLSNDIEEAVDTSAHYCKQQEGIETIFNFTILHNVSKERKLLHDLIFSKIFSNSFSTVRSRFDEFAKISLTSKERK